MKTQSNSPFPRPLALPALALLAAMVASCSDPPPPTFEVAFHVESDPGLPLAGAVLTRNGKDVATSDAQGNTKLTIQGREGSSLEYMVRCPIDYEAPTRPVNVILRTVLDPSRPPEYPITCSPQIRKVVIAIRAEGGQNLPVMYLKQKVATTDASGAATILLNMRPGEQFELGLDTTAKGYERLRPQNPIQAFHVNPKDEVIPWNAKFVLEKGVVRRGPIRVGPTQL